MRLMRFATLFMLGAASAGAASAHGGHAGAHLDGFVHGLMHPLGGIDHLAAMAAVGLLAVTLGGRARLLLPASFMAAMLAGFVLGANAVSLPGVEMMILASGAVIAALALPRLRVPAFAAAALVALFGAFHGHAHGAEMLKADHVVPYALGFLAMTGAIHAGAIALTSALLGRRNGRAPLAAA